jgi:hypothetical protein
MPIQFNDDYISGDLVITRLNGEPLSNAYDKMNKETGAAYDISDKVRNHLVSHFENQSGFKSLLRDPLTRLAVMNKTSFGKTYMFAYDIKESEQMNDNQYILMVGSSGKGYDDKREDSAVLRFHIKKEDAQLMADILASDWFKKETGIHFSSNDSLAIEKLGILYGSKLNDAKIREESRSKQDVLKRTFELEKPDNKNLHDRNNLSNKR